MKNFRTATLAGIIVALSGSILMLSLVGLDLLGPDAVSSDKEMVGGTILFLFLYLFLLFAVYFVMVKRKELNNGQLGFREAVLQGLAVSFATAVSSVLFTYIFYEILYPDYVQDLIAALRSKMESNQIPTDKIDLKIEEKQNYYRTGIQSLYSFIGNLITGATFTLLLSIFLKSTKK